VTINATLSQDTSISSTWHMMVHYLHCSIWYLVLYLVPHCTMKFELRYYWHRVFCLCCFCTMAYANIKMKDHFSTSLLVVNKMECTPKNSSINKFKLHSMHPCIEIISFDEFFILYKFLKFNCFIYVYVFKDIKWSILALNQSISFEILAVDGTNKNHKY